MYVKKDISALSVIWSPKDWGSYWTPAVLNQNKSSFSAPPHPLLFWYFTSFIGIPLPKLGQQCFWIDILCTEIYNLLWENAILHISEKLWKILVGFWAYCTKIWFNLILIRIWQTLLSPHLHNSMCQVGFGWIELWEQIWWNRAGKNPTTQVVASSPLWKEKEDDVTFFGKLSWPLITEYILRDVNLLFCTFYQNKLAYLDFFSSRVSVPLSLSLSFSWFWLV